MVIMFSLRAFTIPSCATSNPRVKNIERKTFVQKDQRFDLELWTCDLKVNSKPLLSWDIHCITFGNFSEKGIKYWASITCPTDRPKDRHMQYNMAPIFKGDQNWIVLLFTIGSNRLWRSFKQNKISSNLYWKIFYWNNPSNSEFGILPLIWTPF